MYLVRESAHQIGTNPRLFGIVSVPESENPETSRKATAVLILSSGLLHRVGPYRLHTELARKLASAGFATCRLDQAGRGDSNRSDGITAEQTVEQEILCAQNLLKTTAGTRDIIIVGLCSGADDALDATAISDDVKGIVLLDGFAARTMSYYLSYYATRILDPIRLRSVLRNRLGRLRAQPDEQQAVDEFAPADSVGIRNFPTLEKARRTFGDFFARDGHALCVFTGGVKEYYAHRGQLRSNLGVARSDKRLSEVYYPAANHTYPIVAHRRVLIDEIASWCEDRFR